MNVYSSSNPEELTLKAVGSVRPKPRLDCGMQRPWRWYQVSIRTYRPTSVCFIAALTTYQAGVRTSRREQQVICRLSSRPDEISRMQIKGLMGAREREKGEF